MTSIRIIFIVLFSLQWQAQAQTKHITANVINTAKLLVLVDAFQKINIIEDTILNRFMDIVTKDTIFYEKYQGRDNIFFTSPFNVKELDYWADTVNVKTQYIQFFTVDMHRYDTGKYDMFYIRPPRPYSRKYLFGVHNGFLYKLCGFEESNIVDFIFGLYHSLDVWGKRGEDYGQAINKYIKIPGIDLARLYTTEQKINQAKEKLYKNRMRVE